MARRAYILCPENNKERLLLAASVVQLIVADEQRGIDSGEFDKKRAAMAEVRLATTLDGLVFRLRDVAGWQD